MEELETGRLEGLEARIAELEQRQQLLQRGDPAIALGTDLVDLGGVPTIKMRQTSARTIANTTATVMTLEVVDFDLFGDGADLSNNQIVVRRSGLYLVIGGVKWTADSTGARYAGYLKNAEERLFGGHTSGSANSSRPSFAWVEDFKVGDTLQLIGYQVSGGNLDTLPGDDMPGVMMVLLADLPHNLT